MAARHTGTVSHIDEADGFGEISLAGHMPLVCELGELRAIGADKIGVMVDFEFGIVRLRGAVGPPSISGAVSLTKPRPGS